MIIYSDLGTRTLAMDESWRKNVIVYNNRRNTTREISFIEVTPYLVKAVALDLKSQSDL